MHHLKLVEQTLYVGFRLNCTLWLFWTNVWIAANQVCNPTSDGRQYVGHVSVTSSGKQCQAWASNSPVNHSYTQDSMYPDGSRIDASNYCRNPASDWDGGVWCYTMDPEQRWERCDVPLCGQLLCCILYQLNHCRHRMSFHLLITVLHNDLLQALKDAIGPVSK